MREVTVAGISIDQESKSPILLLRVKGEDNVLPIWIGPAEAGAISVAINRVPMPRPMTHDLMLVTLRSLNVNLTAVRITAMREGTFYAEIDIRAHNVTLTIDCRPSDAVALALRADIPIYAKEEVIEDASKNIHECGLLEGEQLLVQDLLSGIETGAIKIGDGAEDGKTIVLSEEESEEFLNKLLRALEPESKYKM
jgi:hypothetical protein